MVKKLVSFLLVFIIALGLVSMGFAEEKKAVFSDITDSKVKEAAERLYSLKIVEGDTEGKFHPSNKLTRAEMTKMLVLALGFDNTSIEAAKGIEQFFEDVPKSHWAAGYVNIALNMGIIKGTGEKTFSPDKLVSYPEALAMLVRALGYKDEFLPGSWPGNYMAKAADLDITEGIQVSADGTVDRGAFAIMMNKTLDTHILKIVGTEKINGEAEAVKYDIDTETTLYKKSFGK